MKDRRKLTIIACIAASLAVLQVNAQIPAQLEHFDIKDVRLSESAFKKAQDMDIRYLLSLDPDRLLAPYMKEAGLEPKAENYTNWENTGLDGHIGGHYLSALSYMYASTGNQEIKERLDYYISELKRCVDAEGYLSGVPHGRQIWKEISEGNIRAASFGLNDRWVPLYNIHKIYAGLRDAYLITGNKDALKMFLDLTEWMYNLTEGLTEEQLQDMLRSEQGGLNEVFADAAALSGDTRYLDLAKRFSHKYLLDFLIAKEDKLTGMHANTQIPKVIGYKRIADIEGNQTWNEAASFFWETVVEKRSISIGGNSVYEHFHPAEDFSSMLTSEQGPETCNTYNMLRLSKMLYTTSADSKYMDYYERALYNHILSTINPIQGGFVYFTPMRSGHYRVYSQPQTSFWCCVGSGIENHARYGEMIYSHKADEELVVNLFIPSTLKWGKTVIEQINNFPAEEGTTLLINPKKASEFTVSIRVPEWTSGDRMNPRVNGEAVEGVIEEGFLKIDRKWTKGDRLTVDLPMSLRAVQLPDMSENYSFMYGPMVLAASLGKEDQLGMYADDSRGGHIAAGKKLPLNEMPLIVGEKEDMLSHISKVEGRPLTFRMTGLAPLKYKELTLVPFSSLHECRYMVYWPLVSEDEWKARLAKQEMDEKARIALEMMTADKVTCGEQQPESDHFANVANSVNGDNDGRHWRRTRNEGWFSYVMNPKGKTIQHIRIVCQGQEGNEATVLVNEVEAGNFRTMTPGNEEMHLVPVPAEFQNADLMTITIKGIEGKSTPMIYEVRLSL
ncbi:MAG: glycoside hydrolase family 127 protein [Bacteroidales bacterium]|nr:glycoside hydrolase family 127 protein [Bacteroidales bacterium]